MSFIKRPDPKQVINQELLERIICYNKAALQSQFEHDSVKHFKRNNINRLMKAFKDRYNETLNARREALKALYAQDVNEVALLLQKMTISPEERVKLMRNKVHEFKAEKEKERMKVVNEKLNQQWVNNCDDLRLLHSKMLVLHIDKIRKEQVEELRERRRQESAQEKEYERLWEVDRQKKIQREMNDSVVRQKIQEETTIALDEQMAHLAAQRSLLVELKRQEKALINEELTQIAIEDERKAKLQLASQIETREALDKFNKRKIKAAKRAQKEALDADILFLEKMRALEQASIVVAQENKEKDRNEALAYKAYLDELKFESQLQEKECEEMYQKESDAQWERRTKKWDDEKRKRDILLEQVSVVRKRQIEESMERIRKEKINIEKERERIETAVREAQRLEKVKKESDREKVQIFLKGLDEQVSKVHEFKKQMMDNEKQSLEQDRLVQKAYDDRLRMEKKRIMDGGRIKN